MVEKPTLLLAAALLAGCTQGPNYQGPPPVADTTGPFLSAPDSQAAADVPDSWWHLYDDPVADRLVQQSLAANGDLKIALTNLQQARAAVSAARGGLFPTTTESGGGEYGRNVLVDTVAAIFKVPPSDDWTTTGGVSLGYEVDLFGRVQRSIEAARADADATAAMRDAAQVMVVAEVIKSYADACSAGEQLAVAQHSLQVAQQSLNYTKLAAQYGAAPELDVQRSATVVATSRAAIPPLDAARRNAALELAYLIGSTPKDVPPEALSCTTTPTLRDPLPTGDALGLLRRRPDIRAAERKLAAATARIGVAVASLYPTISLAASASLAANSVLQSADAFSYGLGPLISWSFPNLSVQYARIRQSRAAAAGDLTNFDDTVREALTEVEQALTIYASDLHRDADLQDAEQHSTQAYNLAEQAAREGSASRLDVTVAEQTLIGVSAQRAAVKARIADDQIAVFKALGGGWAATP